MAYAAADSLAQTVERLDFSRNISIVPNSSPKILRFLLDELFSLQSFLEKWNRRRVNMERVSALDEQIRETVSQLEEALISHVSNQFASQTDREQIYPLLFSLDLQELKQEIDSFAESVDTLKEAYDSELSNKLPQKKENDPSTIDPDMVGLSDQFAEIKNKLAKNLSQSKRMTTVSLVGMAAIGKTTLAMKLFRDPLIQSHFPRRAFVKVGPKYRLEDVLLSILKQVNPEVVDEGENTWDQLTLRVQKILNDGRYFIVLDDVWDEDIWADDLMSSFPVKNGGSHVLLTTRLDEVAETANRGCKYKVRFLNKKESWDLLREKVFGKDRSCSYKLEKPGKKIAENCEGLPLTIVTVANILCQADDKTSEYWDKVAPVYWDKVAADKKDQVFVDAYERMLHILYPSYNYLPQQRKTSFLYMGVFPQNHEIHCSGLINLWRAEGFSGAHLSWDQEYYRNRVAALVSRNIVMIGKESYNQGQKTCSLHSTFWYLCNKEAMKIKFYYGLHSLADALAEEELIGQPRLCIRNNVLFGIKEAYNSMASISTIRSLLCTGPYHQYPVPMCLDSKLLRVLDALTIRFYEFPVEVVKLYRLRYLALTFNGELPASISKLWNLEFLIVNRHLNIIEYDGSLPYLPIEIWDMEGLKHLQIMGSKLPDPSTVSMLPLLSALLDASPQSCTKDVFRSMAGLQKLGIQIELAPDAVEPLSCFDHISLLHDLRSLKCVVVNPEIMSKVVAPPAPLSMFPSSLVKLTLSGLGYPWEEMSKISWLPKLRVLKLRCYAFRGSNWEVVGKEFECLEFLLIEDTDLVHWTFPSCSGLNALRSLSIKRCFGLKEIPRKFGQYLKKIELVDCSTVALACAKKLKEGDGSGSLVLDLHSSLNDKNKS